MGNTQKILTIFFYYRKEHLSVNSRIILSMDIYAITLFNVIEHNICPSSIHLTHLKLLVNSLSYLSCVNTLRFMGEYQL